MHVLRGALDWLWFGFMELDNVVWGRNHFLYSDPFPGMVDRMAVGMGMVSSGGQPQHSV